MSAVTRSPNYPTVSLGEAITRIKAIYQKEHTHPAEREVLAKALGYSGLNGASATLLSALSKYGLLEVAKDGRFKVSALALDLILHRKGDPEYTAAIRRAAFLPALFRDLHEMYGDTLPSEHNFRAYLVKKGFNPKTVDGVIRSYRDTIEFVDGETEGATTDPSDEHEFEVPMQVLPVAPAPPSPELVPIAVSAPVSLAQFDEAYNLAADCKVRIAFTGRVTQEAIDKFIAYLNISKDTYPTRVEAEQEDALSVTMDA